MELAGMLLAVTELTVGTRALWIVKMVEQLGHVRP